MAKAKANVKKPTGLEKARAVKAKKQLAVKAERAKAAKIAETATKVVIKALAPQAKEINIRFERAEVAETKADDHRLAAALMLAEAKQRCDDNDVNFKKWCEANITKAYNTVRQLAAIGAADNPEQALQDLRAGTAARVKVHADKKKIAPQEVKAGSATPFKQASEAITRLEDKPALNLIESVAVAKGLRVVSKTDHDDLKSFRKQMKTGPGLKAVVNGFNALKASEQMIMAEHASAKVGCTLTKPIFDAEPPIPGFLDRKGAVKRGAKVS